MLLFGVWVGGSERSDPAVPVEEVAVVSPQLFVTVFPIIATQMCQ